MPATQVRVNPMTLRQVDEAPATCAEALPALDGSERAALRLEIDRLLELRPALTEGEG